MSNHGKSEKPIQKIVPAKQPITAPTKTGTASTKPALLLGGNPQIAKGGDGAASVQALSSPCQAGKSTSAAASTR